MKTTTQTTPIDWWRVTLLGLSVWCGAWGLHHLSECGVCSVNPFRCAAVRSLGISALFLLEFLRKTITGSPRPPA